jgi:hypothetical protein
MVQAGLMLTDMVPPSPEALKAMVANLSIPGKESLGSVSVARDEQIIDSPNHVSAGHDPSGINHQGRTALILPN